MKERPILFKDEMIRAILNGSKTQTRRIIKPQPLPGEIGTLGRGVPFIRGEKNSILCPYGQPGDRLWVRETHAIEGSIVRYHATDNVNELRRKRPSIHMPRWASRLTLEITRVRVERLQACNEVDAIAEGAPWAACGSPQEGSRKAGFAALWESINGPGSWDANPWVWVVEFKRVQS